MSYARSSRPQDQLLCSCTALHIARVLVRKAIDGHSFVLDGQIRTICGYHHRLVVTSCDPLTCRDFRHWRRLLTLSRVSALIGGRFGK